MQGTTARYLIRVEDALPNISGNKAAMLAYLKKEGYRIPQTFVISARAHEDFSAGRDGVLLQLTEELDGLINPDKSYAVRSSADVEDSQKTSFAGQFETYLNVKGVPSVVEAVEKVWSSATQERVRSYEQKTSSQRAFRMAVIVQEMVPADFSGVVFTRNPITGRYESIVEAVPGFGDALVQGGESPLRWVFRRGELAEAPDPHDLESLGSSMPSELPLLVAKEAEEISRRAGWPVDMEWAHFKELYWLQMRRITTFESTSIYSNRISREFIPGCITPLVWSVNTLVVNSAWKRLLVKLLGKDAQDIRIDEMARLFYGRAYFNMGIMGDLLEKLGFPRESIEIMLGLEEEKTKIRPGLRLLAYLPNLLILLAETREFAANFDLIFEDLKERYEWFEKDISSLDEAETLQGIHSLIELSKGAAYYNIVAPIMLGLSRIMLNKFAGENVDLDFDYSRDQGLEKRLAELRALYDSLPEQCQQVVRSGDFNQLTSSGDPQFVEAFLAFLNDFGYLRDSGNDFFLPSWKERPEVVQKIVSGYQATGTRKAQKKQDLGLIASFAYGWFKASFERKERMSLLYTYGYGLFRPYFLHWGRLLLNKGLKNSEDIFFLSLAELEKTVSCEVLPSELLDLIVSRREDFKSCQMAEVPDIIYGETAPPLAPARMKSRIKGIAASMGYYSGPARVITGVSEMHKLKEGDVLVIPHSDVGLTPLFAKAGAVVSESGGLLSHSAIVAREYGIPAVVSAKGACRVKDGTKVVVDGFRGEMATLEA